MRHNLKVAVWPKRRIHFQPDAYIGPEDIMIHTVDFYFDPFDMNVILDAIKQVDYEGLRSHVVCMLVGRKLWETAMVYAHQYGGLTDGNPEIDKMKLVLCPTLQPLGTQPVFDAQGTLATVYLKEIERNK